MLLIPELDTRWRKLHGTAASYLGTGEVGAVIIFCLPLVKMQLFMERII